MMDLQGLSYTKTIMATAATVTTAAVIKSYLRFILKMMIVCGVKNTIYPACFAQYLVCECTTQTMTFKGGMT